MNCSGIVEITPRSNVVQQGERFRANLRPGSRLRWSLPAIIKSEVAVEHAGIAHSLRFMAQHFHTPIRVTDLMTVTGLSRRGYLESFQKHTGRNPGEVLRRMRIEHAKWLLAERDLTLSQLGRRRGLSEDQQFLRGLQGVTGLSPTKYRMQVRAGINGEIVRLQGAGSGSAVRLNTGDMAGLKSDL